MNGERGSGQQFVSRTRRLCGLLASVIIVLQVLIAEPAHAGDESNANPAKPDAGRIFTYAQLTRSDAGDPQDAFYGLLSIDATTGRFERIDVEQAGVVRLSPDGGTLAYSRGDAVWTNNLQGDSPSKILDFGGMICWSPDGRELVCSTTKVDRKDAANKESERPLYKNETWRLNSQGDHPYTIRVPDTDAVQDWSADGKWFVTISDRDEAEGAHEQIYVMRTDGTQQRPLVKGTALNLHPRFSPDGRKIVYLQHQGGTNRVRVVDFDGRHDRVIYEEDGRTCPHAACWSPDGKQLAIVVFDWQIDEKGRRVLDTSRPANFRFLIADIEGERRRELRLETARGVGWMYSPDWR